jgi:hypothetical protein
MDEQTNIKKESNKKILCYRCEKELEFEVGEKILRHEECLFCGAELHCCKMCLFYDVLVYNECKETNAERITDKEKPNFCSYFTLGRSLETTKSDKPDPLEAANALFKN